MSDKRRILTLHIESIDMQSALCKMPPWRNYSTSAGASDAGNSDEGDAAWLQASRLS